MIKKILLVSFLILCADIFSFGQSFGDGKKAQIFLLVGQSNMAG
jgi:hypothetical protein